MQKFGIVQLRTLIGLTAVLGTTISNVLADGKVDWKDTAAIMPLFGALKDITGLDLNQIVPEITDLDQAEIAELGLMFEQKLNLTDDNLEAKVEQGLKIVLKSVDAIKFFKSLAS